MSSVVQINEKIQSEGNREATNTMVGDDRPSELQPASSDGLPQLPMPIVFSLTKSSNYQPHGPPPKSFESIDLEAQSPPRHAHGSDSYELDQNPMMSNKPLRLRGGCCCDCLYDLLRCLLCCCIFEAICDMCC